MNVKEKPCYGLLTLMHGEIDEGKKMDDTHQGCCVIHESPYLERMSHRAYSRVTCVPTHDDVSSGSEKATMTTRF